VRRRTPPAGGPSSADRAEDWLAAARRHPKPTGAISPQSATAAASLTGGITPTYGGRVGEPKRGHQQGRGHIVGRENVDLACFGEFPGRTGCGESPPMTFGAPPSRSPCPAGFFGNSGEEGRIDIQLSAKHAIGLCASWAGRPQVIYSFRTVQTTFSLVKVSLWT
jgi:hypothetical protein